MNALDGELRDGRHVMSVRVYYEDTDFSGIVYHATYLRFMERGRTNHLRLVGAGHRVLFEQASAEAPGFAFVVRSMQIEFLKSARMDDVLEVVTTPEEVKGASITLKQRILRADELLVEARLPLLPADTRCGFYEFSRRAGDYAIAMALATLRIEGGIIADPRVGVGGAEATPRRIPAAETALAGPRVCWSNSGGAQALSASIVRLAVANLEPGVIVSALYG